MMASATGLRDRVPDPTRRPARRRRCCRTVIGGHSRRRPRPVNALFDPHHFADTDPVKAGGDALRTGFNILITLTPKVQSA